MFVHCNRKILSDEIWYLYDNEVFTDRRLKMTICPTCGHILARLIETRKTDGKKFDEMYSKGKARKLIDECKKELNYSNLDIPKGNKTLYGFRYGENKEYINKKTGETIIIQKACDFYGNKETVKRIKEN